MKMNKSGSCQKVTQAKIHSHRIHLQKKCAGLIKKVDFMKKSMVLFTKHLTLNIISVSYGKILIV